MKSYTKTIEQLFATIADKEVIGDDQKVISSLHIDSREVVAGSLFIAIVGEKVDGHTFIDTAIEKGATAIVCEHIPEICHPEITYIRVPDTKKILGILADTFYDHPSQTLKVIGVTGTNGKTTIATALYNAMTDLGYISGLISTIENKIGKEIFATERTTPDALSLQKLFAQMRDAGCAHVFMEVSSHALILGRVAATHFTGAIFTNLTQDHLDFHHTLEAYADAKKMLFDILLPTAFAITNTDDGYGAFMTADTQAPVIGYGLGEVSDVHYTVSGTHYMYQGVEFYTPLVGAFNLYNTLAILHTLEQLGIAGNQLHTAIQNLQAARGRFELVLAHGRIGIVDYAHTPDALKNVLETINHLKTTGQHVFTITGAGGDRDTGKRVPMAQIACELSDMLILTSDNPRTEDPEKILDDMEAGIQSNKNFKYKRIADRAEAIQTAIALSKENDIILIAGKGHETYQEVNGVKTHFDDKEEFLK